jgi:hypothetical protein
MTRHNKLWSLSLVQIINIKSFVSFSPLLLIWKDIFLTYGPRFVSLTRMN